jgi:GMP synthase (glutamine-hydrolysing)
MIAFVDIQHPSIVDDPEQGPRHAALRQTLCQRIEQATGLPCRLVDHRRFSRAWADRAGVRAIMISGNSVDWDRYAPDAFAPLAEVMRDGGIPMLGFCGGHQLVAMLAGGDCGPIGPLPAGVPDPDPAWGATMAARGMQREVGVLPVVIERPDPLLANLPSPFLAWQSHYWEVKRLPPGFVVLAASAVCRVQVMRHLERPWFGTQFHPERYDEGYPAGAQLLRNFCRMHGLI